MGWMDGDDGRYHNRLLLFSSPLPSCGLAWDVGVI